MNITILQSKLLARGVIDDLDSLLREFRPDSKPLGVRQWRHILAQKDVRLFVAREAPRQARGKAKIVGMAMLCWHKLPVGTVGTVEDVVVNSAYRGKGYGAGLTEAVIEFAKKRGMAYIDLTSRPTRIAANKLYQKFGWKKRQTNVYRLVPCSR